MWKNWIPFRRKQKEEVVPANHVNGKENSEEINQPLQQQREGNIPDGGVAGGKSSLKRESSSSGSDVLQNYASSRGSTNKNMRQMSQENYDHHSSMSILNRTLPNHLSPNNIGNNNDRGNQSFTAVHGPLLSTPIMPKVRRVVETSAGIRSSGRTSLLSRGKPVGRSLSLNYGSNNPAKSRAGQVPWVRLKRRESLGLADYISGRTPQSPNTVKLAPPEPSGLPPAPSFRSTPLIVTTEMNRSRVLDTQTVVSALREKRKRFGESQVEESISEDISWQKSPKRRRQDSSQSNASSVSIPPMPDTLPNLITTPGTSSMLHIEHLSNQRPSTIPAMDVFSNHHKTGLGGEQAPQQVLSQSQDRSKSDLNNSRLAQKALQSSLSSSLRARHNLSLLERGGVDLKRIRNHGLHRRASDASTLERIRDEPQSKVARPSIQTSPQSGVTSQMQMSTPTVISVTTATVPSSTPLVSTVSAPTKRKIAEGVMLRKQSLSMNSPVQTLKSIPSNGMMSTSDFEKDKQKEYQRRVLDLLQSDDKETVSTASSEKISLKTAVTSAATGSSLLTTPLTTPVSASSSAATSIAISASLDILNKLVQSTTSTAPAPLGTLAPISSVKSDNLVATNLASTTGVSSLSSSGFNFGATSTSAQPLSSASSVLSTPLATALQNSTASVTTGTSTLGTGFSFGTQPQTTLPLSTASLSLSSGFQVNFGSVVSSTPVATTNSVNALTSPVSALSKSAEIPSNNLFNFGVPSNSSSVTASSSGGFNFSVNSTSSSVMTTLSQSVSPSVPSGPSQLSQVPATSLSAPPQFSAQTSLAAANALTSVAPANFPATTIQTGGFQFGAHAAQTTLASEGGLGGFKFGATAPQSSVATVASASSAQPGMFNFGAPSQTSTQSSSGGFNFSAQPAATASSGQTLFGTVNSSTLNVSSSVSNSNSTAGFQFSTPAVSSGNATATFAGGFSFNASQSQPNASVIASQPPASTMFTASVANPSPSGGFNFSQNTSSVQTPAFAFGANAKPSAFGSVSSNTSVSQSAFGMPTSATGNQTAFGTATSAGGNQTAFGTSTSAAGNQTAFGTPTSAAGNQTAFGTPAVSSTATPALFQFGANPSTATATPSPFGAVATSTANPNPFGAAASSSVNQGLFNFGAANTTSTAASVFGNVTNSTAASQSPFGAANPTPFGAAAPKPSIFGAPAPASTSVFSPASTQSMFGAAPGGSFGTNVSTASFGSSASLTTAPAFGSATPSNQPFTFGAQQSSTSQPAAFGSATGSVFGGTNATSTTGTPSVFGSTAPPGGNVFGGMNQTTTSASQPPVFGSPAAPSVFGASQAAPPAFGSGQSVFGATNSSAATFGAPSTQQGGASVFGAGAQNSQSSSTTPFGSANAFGAPKPTPNPFGAPASTTQGASFVFAGAQSGQNAASPFGAQTASTASTGFNFGQAAPQSPNPSGGFNFSAQSPAPAPAFQAPSPGGFNFSAGAGATPNFNFSAAPSTPNMFTPQTQGHRPRAVARRPQRRGRK